MKGKVSTDSPLSNHSAKPENWTKLNTADTKNDDVEKIFALLLHDVLISSIPF